MIPKEIKGHTALWSLINRYRAILTLKFIKPQYILILVMKFIPTQNFFKLKFNAIKAFPLTLFK